MRRVSGHSSVVPAASSSRTADVEREGQRAVEEGPCRRAVHHRVVRRQQQVGLERAQTADRGPVGVVEVGVADQHVVERLEAEPHGLEIRAQHPGRRIGHAGVEQQRASVFGEHVLRHEAHSEGRLDAVNSGAISMVIASSGRFVSRA